MARTDSIAVIALLDFVPAKSIDSHIEIANVMVTDCCAAATTATGADYYTAARLELIERWLAAHYCCVSFPRGKMEGTKNASQTKRGQTGKGLEATLYGQQAMSIDIAGGLKVANDGKYRQLTAGLSWLGYENGDTTT